MKRKQRRFSKMMSLEVSFCCLQANPTKTSPVSVINMSEATLAVSSSSQEVCL